MRLTSSFRIAASAAFIAALLSLASPLVVSAQTAAVATLQQQLQTLLAEIAQLQQSATSTPAVSFPTTSGTSASSNVICPTIVRTLALGSSGTDVANLQGFLAQNPLIYPEGTVTGYFGMLTQDAVQRWQSAYGIVSSGTPSTTGYGAVGPKTAAAISASCMKSSSGTGSSASSAYSQQPLCPVAAQPATPCPGTWSPLTNATGCTIAWQCAVPLPGATSSSSTVSATSSSAVSSCAAYTMPQCQGGTLQWLGMSANNCNLGYQCITH